MSELYGNFLFSVSGIFFCGNVVVVAVDHFFFQVEGTGEDGGEFKWLFLATEIGLYFLSKYQILVSFIAINLYGRLCFPVLLLNLNRHIDLI